MGLGEKLWKIFVNDLTRKEGETKEFTTFTERQAYTYGMAVLLFGLALLAYSVSPVLTGALVVAALYKGWIAAKNKE